MEIDPFDERDLYNRPGKSSGGGDIVSTTISTIVVHGGPLQLVIALLRSGESLHIKVTEIIPKFTFLGRSLDEALNLQKQHEDLLLNIQNLPTPLEEFYRKIQEKIAANEPQNPRLIEDMAESLSRVWSDILKLLHDRRTIINANVLFFERLGECYGKMSALECACRDTMIPIEVEAVREFLEKFKHLRVEVLAAIVNPLTVGNQLLEKLKDIASVGSLDSRPDHIFDESRRSVTQVELWLEDLSDKRNNLESAWLNRKIQLEQCLILAQLSKDLVELEKMLNKQRDEILGTFTLGDSARTAQSLLQDYGAWKADAMALRDKSLKITKTTEEVVRGGNFTGDEACAKAYQVLASCSEYLDEIDVRESLLQQSQEFFTRAEIAMRNFDELEIDLKRVSLRPGSPNFIPVHLKLMQEVSTAINGVLEFGYSLIDEVGRTKPEVLGVKAVVDEIERRKLSLEAAFSRASEKHIKVSDELNTFLQQYNDIFSWIETQKRDRIINGPLNFMGSNAQQAKDCLNSHQQLLRQLEIKEEEFKQVQSKMTPFLECLEDSQRDDVSDKVAQLLKNWTDLNSFVRARVPIIELYLRFHQEADHLVNLFNNLEQTLRATKRADELHYIDTVWSKIQTQFALLKSIATLFSAEKIKVAEPYLQVDRAASCIEKTLDAFGSRQLEISGIWEKVTSEKEITVILERIMAENVDTLSLTAKIEEELYPIIATSEESPRDLIRFVENKLKSVSNEIQQSEIELSRRIDKVDKLEVSDQVSIDKIVQVKNNLNSIKTKLFTISADYHELVDIVLSFLRSYHEIYESIREYFSVRDQTGAAAPVGGENVASLIRDYETFKNNTMESFRSLLAQSEKLIDRIKMQEPPGAKEQDTDKIITLLERLRTYFETNASSENSELKRQYFVAEFQKMLKDLNENISDLQLQHIDMSDKFGDSAAACKVASLSYEYYERNVDLLNKRIENFINSYAPSNVSYPDAQPYVDDELKKLQRRWDEFRSQTSKLKSTLSQAQQYFNLLDTVDTRYHKTYTFLVNSVNLRKDELKTSSAAFDLIDELEKFVIDNKQSQLDDLKRLSQLSQDVFGYDKTETLFADNVFIFQSFEKVKSDIVDLVKDLKKREDPVAMINEIDSHILVIESSEEGLKHENVHEIVPVIENEPPKFLRYLESAEVTEGESFAFECILTGYPEPSVQWQKYNAPLTSGPNYNVSFANGKCRLEMPRVSPSDAAVFSCIASNVAGTSQTTANLIVKPREEMQPLTPPSFVRRLQNGYANEKSPFEFNCLVEGNPLPTVQWYRNDKCVDNDANYNITYNNGNAILRIPAVRVDDQGVFTVRAANQAGQNECSAIFSVEAVEKHMRPTVTSPLSNVVTRAGQKITLRCDIVGKPRPEIYVMHNGKPLAGHDVNYDGEAVKFIIPEASSSHSGIYRILARNLAGQDSSECYVSVEREEPPPVAAAAPETVAPSIQQPLRDTAVFEGKPILLEAIIVGQPEPEVIWLHNDAPVKESNDIQLYFQGDSCTLYISEAFTEDAGAYKVVALNSAGEASSECRVSVTPLNILEPAIRPPPERLVSSGMPPKFEKLLTDMLANAGETVELECCLAAGGGPLPEIKWYLNNKEIIAAQDERIQAHASEDGTLKLIIRNAQPEDKGVYTVKATNSTGVAKCFMHLIVKLTANSASETNVFKGELPEQLLCPTFRELFADRSVNYGDSTKFECIVHGKPTPKIRWTFNDHPVQGRDFLVSTSGERQVLTIPKVTPATVGRIACIAESEAGKATCVANLTGSGIPLSTEHEFSTQEDVTGSSFVSMQKHVTTTTSTSTKNVFGNGLAPQSQFHSTTEQLDSSYKQVGDLSPEISESKTFEEVRESSPPQTFAQKLLNFSKNDLSEKHESIIAQSGQITTGKPIRRNVAPRFVSPLIGKIVDQGVDVVIEGIVDGYPAPNVEFKKNEETLAPQPGKIEFSYSLNKVVIKLFNVTTKDAGRYSAIAKNDAGSATSTADLVVKKSIFPPVFGRRLQAQVVKRGDRVIMDCEITGTPEPTVSWYKDDRPLGLGSISEHKITQLGICHKLIIESVKVEDAGKYMVKAENSGGEAQSIADFMVVESQPDRLVEVTKTVVFSDLPADKLKTDPLPDQPKLPQQPQQNGFSVHQEISSQAQLGSSTESKVVTETTRTTSATVRLEHKPNFSDLPPLTFSQRTQTPTIPHVSEGTMVDKVTQQTESTQTQVKQETKEIPFPQQPEPLRSSALDFFESNLKNLPPLSEDKYTRFEDAMKGKTYVHKQEEIKQQFHSKLNDDLSFFNLKPEPPPEMSFMPKTPQATAPPEKIVEKVKRLEEMHQASETPLSGTIHPGQGYRKEEKFEKREFLSTKSTSPFVQKPISPVPTYLPQANRDQLAPEPAGIIGRSASPKPSTEGVNMEKLWAMKPKSPEPFSQHYSQQSQQTFSHEHKSSFVAYSTQKQVQAQEFVQPQAIEPPPKEHFVPIQPYQFAAQPQQPEQPQQQEEMPKTSIRDTKSFFEQRIKEEEIKATPLLTDLKAPGLVKQFAKPMVPLVPDNYELGIEPGEAPEICYAPKPVLERKQSYVEKIEKSLEQNIEREPERVPRGGVRILPSRQTPQRHLSQSPQRHQSPKPTVQQLQQQFIHTEQQQQQQFIRNEQQQSSQQPEPVMRDVPILPGPPLITPEPFVPQQPQQQQQTFESKEYRSENIEFKKETFSENKQGYRHVEPPKFLQRGKSSEPSFIPPPSFAAPFIPPETKSQSVTREVPITLQRQEPVKKAPQPKPFQPAQPLYQAPPPAQPLYQAPPPTQPLYQAPPPAQPLYQAPLPAQPVYQAPPPKQLVKPAAQNFGEYISETHESHQSLYRNFVKSEQKVDTSESYFQRVASPKTIQPPAQQQQQQQQKQPFSKKPETQQSQESKTAQMMKNISMTSKQIRVNEEPIAVLPPVQNMQSHFTSTTMTSSSSESKYEEKIQPVWRPSSEHTYKPVTPNLPHTPQHFASAHMQSPPAPSAFETPLQYAGAARPKFEPIDKPLPMQHVKKVEQKQPKVFKPTPVTPARSAHSNYVENSSQQNANDVRSYYYSSTAPPKTTTYYTGVAGQPVHNAIAHETSNTVHMKESTEKSHRVVNITQTRRVIALDPKKEEQQQQPQLEPFPFSPEPQQYYGRQRVPPPPTPTKFVPGEFRESDYDSELEGTRIRPIWTPGQGNGQEHYQYRRVRPPSSRSSSVPPSSRNYERVMTPMEFDTAPVVMPTRIKIESPSLKTPQQYFASALYKDQQSRTSQTLDRQYVKREPAQATNVTRDDIGIQKSSFTDHASTMNTAFKTKAHQFMRDVMSDQHKQQPQPQKPILKKTNSLGGEAQPGGGSQAYREESRVSQYGTKHVDPDTGIIYFKYDFGYEFGVIFQDGKKVVGGVRSSEQPKRVLPQRSGDIEMPVLHERTGRASVVSFGATTPIEFERLEKAKKRYSLPTNDLRFSPRSGTMQASDYSVNNSYDRSGSNTPFDIVNAQKQAPPKNPPMFITPLKDIAVVAGQTARFECIVQCDPHTVYWTKNGQPLESSLKHQIEYRNGVCRCTIPQAGKDDAGMYECIAQNNLGAETTGAMLIIPGDKRGYRVY